MIQSEDYYIGCRVHAATTVEEIFSFEFNQGVSIDGIDLDNAMVDCLQLTDVPCKDGKMCATAYGLLTCGLFPPCPKCLWPLRERAAPAWVADHAPEMNTNAIIPTKDYTEKIGNCSRNESYYHFLALIGDTSCNAPLKLKKDVYSVVHRPLLYINDDLLFLRTGDPMHVSQGMMTHLTEETVVQLQKVALSEPEFIEDETTKVRAFIETMASRENSFAYKHAESLYKKEDRLVQSTFNNRRAADDDNVARCYDSYTAAVMQIDEVGQQVGYQDTSRKLNRPKELKSLLHNLEKSKKKNFTKAVYLFMKAIKTFVGDFNKNHGQYELTTARGIKALRAMRKFMIRSSMDAIIFLLLTS